MIDRNKKLLLSREESDLLINDKKLGIARIMEIINRLTDKTNGCPWDQIQTTSSLAKYTIEEAYEVADSIESQSPNETKKELGDLLFNILFHIHLASQNGHFNLTDVINETVDKMVFRHPHVFKNKKIETISEVHEQWEEIKRDQSNIGQTGRIKQELKNIASNAPALTRSLKIQEKVGNIGFDWNATFEIINKIYEEIDEFIEESEQNDKLAMLDEIGDILFSVVNLARFVGIDPETALRSTNRKFVERIVEMERLFNKEGKNIKDSNKTELNQLWTKIKRRQ